MDGRCSVFTHNGVSPNVLNLKDFKLDYVMVICH